MKFNYKKIASVFASAVMLSSTIGFAAAAAYPAPFVSSGVADGAIVVGTAADVRDWTAGMGLQTDLNAGVSGSGGGATVTGTAWQVKTGSDNLELSESIYDVETYIGDDSLPILANGEISNEKGTAKYEQFMYFDDAVSSRVSYQQDDGDNVGLFFKINSGISFARYVLDFTTALKSDITTASVLEDIEDEAITILGKTYTITKAVNTSSGTQLTLMSGADKTTIANGEEIVVGGKTVSVVVTSTTSAEFTVDGETTNSMDKGDTYKLNDGTYLGVSKITYQNFAGGIMQASFYLGADKIQMNNGSAMEVNAESIGDAVVTITDSISGGDISITDITVNMTAEDDLYVPVNGKLSTAEDLDEPQVLISQNWDIEFAGLNTVETEDLTFEPTGSDKKYDLTMTNRDGNTFTIPLFYTNDTGIYPGKQVGYELRMIINGTATGTYATMGDNITKNDYFILNTADPKSSGSNAKSFLVQYKGSDKVTASSPVATFNVLGVGEQQVNVETSTAERGNLTLKVGGASFKFQNVSTADSSDFSILLSGNDYHEGGENKSTTVYLRTKYNALVNLTDNNYSKSLLNSHQASSANILLNVSIDDANRDGDDVTLGSEAFVGVTFGNATGADATATLNANGNWITDPSNSDVTLYQTRYGADIKATDPDSSPVTLKMTIPESIVEPLVYVTSGDVTITTGSTEAGGQVLFVKDSEVSSVKDKNLIVVGGSCINTVAAKILGGEMLCGSDFTAKTNVGSSQYLIKVVKTSEAVTDGSDAKIAMLVAGYEAADTENAVAKVKEGVSTDIGEQVYPITGA